MSLNNIQLNGHLLAELYSGTLIEAGPAALPDPGPVRYLGNNRKHILVIVAHEDAPFLPDGELGFLSSILAACKLSLADIGIINSVQVAGTAINDLIHSEARQILLFGVEPLSIGLPIHFPAFQLQQFDGRTYLHAPSLPAIEQDKGLKARLWTALKSLFSV